MARCALCTRCFDFFVIAADERQILFSHLKVRARLCLPGAAHSHAARTFSMKYSIRTRARTQNKYGAERVKCSSELLSRRMGSRARSHLHFYPRARFNGFSLVGMMRRRSLGCVRFACYRVSQIRMCARARSLICLEFGQFV